MKCVLNWRDFKNNPPYDAEEDILSGYETDYEYCYFLYKYCNRPDLAGRLFISFRACKFYDGVFEGYESGMRTSPYPTDKIEVTAWLPRGEVIEFLQETYKGRKSCSQF